MVTQQWGVCLRVFCSLVRLLVNPLFSVMHFAPSLCILCISPLSLSFILLHQLLFIFSLHVTFQRDVEISQPPMDSAALSMSLHFRFTCLPSFWWSLVKERR